MKDRSVTPNLDGVPRVVPPEAVNPDDPAAYHVGNNVFFRRHPDGSVEILRKLARIRTERNVVSLLTLDALGWVGLVANMSPDPDGADRWRAARVVHLETDTNEATETETP